MSAVGTTYSFKDLSGAFDNPLIALPLVFGGQVGCDTITVTNDTQHGTKETAADGTVMPSFVAGDSGTVTIVCLQTSIVHKYLLSWLNIVKTAAMNGDVSNWASGRMLLRNALDGSAHDVEGIMPNKIPDKSYALEACNIVSV